VDAGKADNCDLVMMVSYGLSYVQVSEAADHEFLSPCGCTWLHTPASFLHSGGPSFALDVPLVQHSKYISILSPIGVTITAKASTTRAGRSAGPGGRKVRSSGLRGHERMKKRGRLCRAQKRERYDCENRGTNVVYYLPFQALIFRGDPYGTTTSSPRYTFPVWPRIPRVKD